MHNVPAGSARGSTPWPYPQTTGRIKNEQDRFHAVVVVGYRLSDRRVAGPGGHRHQSASESTLGYGAQLTWGINDSVSVGVEANRFDKRINDTYGGINYRYEIDSSFARRSGALVSGGRRSSGLIWRA